MDGRGLLASNFSPKERLFCYIWPMKKENQRKDEEGIQRGVITFTDYLDAFKVYTKIHGSH